ncbi:MAG: hypothetical protein Q8P46_06915 [Hyphomicrobiales bacterium]|nr:hypothetical protein [Hyphomicrobiales bacterium]
MTWIFVAAFLEAAHPVIIHDLPTKEMCEQLGSELTANAEKGKDLANRLRDALRAGHAKPHYTLTGWTCFKEVEI